MSRFLWTRPCRDAAALHGRRLNRRVIAASLSILGDVPSGNPLHDGERHLLEMGLGLRLLVLVPEYPFCLHPRTVLGRASYGSSPLSENAPVHSVRNAAAASGPCVRGAHRYRRRGHVLFSESCRYLRDSLWSRYDNAAFSRAGVCRVGLPWAVRAERVR